MNAEESSAVAVARVVAAATRGTPDVADLHPGLAGEIGTYGSGEKVAGVRVHTKPTRRVTVYLIARYGRPLDELGEDVRSRIEEALGDALPEAAPVPVDVHVVDVQVGEEALPEHADTGEDQAGEGPGREDAGGDQTGAVAQSTTDALHRERYGRGTGQ